VITIHQRGGLQVNDDTAAPIELMAPLAAAGYARVELLLNSRAAHLSDYAPRSYVDKMKSLGLKVWGVVWADSFAEPEACYDYVLAERDRLQVSGFVINAEDGTEARDLAGEKWSRRFVSAYRTYAQTSKLALCLNTYIGCGGIDLRAWQDRGARLIVQTHHEGSTFEWSVEAYRSWAKQYGWTKPSMMKPQFGVYKGADGQFPDRSAQIASAKAAGTVGFSAYYAEGAFSENVLVPLLRAAQDAGVAF